MEKNLFKNHHLNESLKNSKKSVVTSDDSSDDDFENEERMAAFRSVAVDGDTVQGNAKNVALKNSNKLNKNNGEYNIDSLKKGLETGEKDDSDLKFYQKKAQDMLHAHLDKYFNEKFDEENESKSKSKSKNSKRIKTEENENGKNNKTAENHKKAKRKSDFKQDSIFGIRLLAKSPIIQNISIIEPMENKKMFQSKSAGKNGSADVAIEDLNARHKRTKTKKQKKQKIELDADNNEKKIIKF